MKRMFTDAEIQGALDEYEMEDEFVLNDDCKIMFFAGNAGWDVQLWVWQDTRWITHEQVRIVGTGDLEDDKRFGIRCVMERAESLKKVFRFSQTYKKTVTWREYYDIEAESLEEARAIAASCDGDLEDCEAAEFIEAEEDDDYDVCEYQSREIDAIYDPDGNEVE